MLIAQVQFAPWDKVYNFSVGQLELSDGDYVVVETELGRELGKIVSIFNGQPEDNDSKDREIKPISRKANYDDIAGLPSAEKKEEAMIFCREMIERHKLPMKLVDVHFSFEGNRMNFAFISDGRVDFRELVKDLAAHFNVNIRLTQIGTRDEARATGDCGPCGRELCCRGFMNEFSSITSEMAEAQQVVHRGSDRISGMCGRLMCCLSYEYEGYKDMAGKLPPIGTKVNVDGRRGVVVGHHVLKQTVDVKISSDKSDERGVIIQVDINRNKNKGEQKK
ncbi:MAG: regulatory iron-sulfur-containing complex subunit RicT [Patescibacteria group bacterium]|jgi:cell fate regulator YaaT (PSP1 superfamily)